jgi:hypothetical protein
MFNVGVFWANGDGVPTNFREAAKWMRKSGEYGALLSLATNPLTTNVAGVWSVVLVFRQMIMYSRMPLVVPTPCSFEALACVCTMTFLSGVHSSYRLTL